MDAFAAIRGSLFVTFVAGDAGSSLPSGTGDGGLGGPTSTTLNLLCLHSDKWAQQWWTAADIWYPGYLKSYITHNSIQLTFKKPLNALYWYLISLTLVVSNISGVTSVASEEAFTHWMRNLSLHSASITERLEKNCEVNRNNKLNQDQSISSTCKAWWVVPLCLHDYLYLLACVGFNNTAAWPHAILLWRGCLNFKRYSVPARILQGKSDRNVFSQLKPEARRSKLTENL